MTFVAEDRRKPFVAEDRRESSAGICKVGR